MVTNQQVRDPDADLEIRISVDKDAKTITISDTGIGMTREELIENLGTIAHSGTRALIEHLEEAQRSNIIGQFGVGFYSAFVVADEVTVISRSYRPDAEAALWRSHGGESFVVDAAERAQRGTTIILKLKEEAHEFADEWRLRQIVRRHSNYVAFPIYIGNERVNESTALWRQQPRSVEQSQYNEFYRQMTFDYEDPLLAVHFSSEAPLDLHAILFVPAKRERGLIERRMEGKIRLYSRKVLIQEDAKDVLPPYFRFIEGVVDSEDLPLNVSREGVQRDVGPNRDPVLQRIKKSLTNRLTKELVELAEKDAQKYATFWNEFSPFIKEGVATDPLARDDLLPLLRFHTTRSGDQLASLAEYKERMVEGQKEIYYVLAADLESARRSPHLDALTDRGIEALLLYDVMDSFMLNGLREYQGLKLRNVDDPNLSLPGEAPAPEVSISDEQFTRLGERLQRNPRRPGRVGARIERAASQPAAPGVAGGSAVQPRDGARSAYPGPRFQSSAEDRRTEPWSSADRRSGAPGGFGERCDAGAAPDRADVRQRAVARRIAPQPRRYGWAHSGIDGSRRAQVDTKRERRCVTVSPSCY
jgi:molecular chaperone HtpG